MSLALRILTPEGAAFDEAVSAVVVPGLEGQFGVLPRHAPLIAAVDAGIVRAQREGEPAFYVVSGGLAEVQGEGVTLLVEQAHAVAGELAAEERLEQMRADRWASVSG